MSLLDSMSLQNILCNETSSVDVGGNWIEDNQCHVAFRFNEDGEDDIEFHLMMDRDALETLRDFIEFKLSEQRSRLN